jgi:sigma-B regulation protein RsbU (phosphoserine phosphatase)
MKPINKLELMARIRSALRLKQEKDWHKKQDKRIRYELELAKQVQRSVLSDPIVNERIEIKAEYRPSSELAGDYYAWFRIDRNRYGIILLDMMGHGISSSLVCMFISSVLKDLILRITDPEEVMVELNRYMGQLYRRDELINYYFTGIFLVVDTDSQTYEYVNAGHPSGLVITESGCTELTSGGPAIGLFQQIKVTKEVVAYQPGTVIALYTDGLLDAMNDRDDDARREIISSAVRSGRGVSPDMLVNSMLGEGADNAQRDDICLVTVTLS